MKTIFLSIYNSLLFSLICLPLISFANLQAAEKQWECSAVDDELTTSLCIDESGRKLTISEPKELGSDWKVILKFPGGSVFTGYSINNVIYGEREDPNGFKIEGYVNGKFFEGDGKIYFINGDFYEGGLKDNLRYGQGTLTEVEREDNNCPGQPYQPITDGLWDDGFIEGTTNGISSSCDLYSYRGSFDKVTGNKHGYGELIWSNGNSYKGYFIDDMMHGYGINIRNDGSYRGYYEFDKKNGYGEAIYSDGSYTNSLYDTYKGEWKDNMHSGVGTLFNKGKLVFIGNFLKNLRFGQGVLIDNYEDDNEEYIASGQWDDGFTGFGSVYHRDGSNFTGYHVNAVRNGPGKYSWPDTWSATSGFYENGILNGLVTEVVDREMTRELAYVDGKREGAGIAKWDDGTFANIFYQDDEFVDDKYEYFGEGQKSSKLFTSKRIALVIGNAKYLSSPLENAVSDSIGIKSALEDAGFEVIQKSNLTQENFLKTLWEFKTKLKQMGPDTTALFYFAGHALEVDGTNYLNPIDTIIKSKYDLETNSINVNRVFSAVASISTGVKIIILDACRNNPFNAFTRSPSEGLAQMNAPTGTIIGYSTAPGSVALDGLVDGYSLYTGSLINAINIPNITIEQAFKKTRQLVVKSSNSQQIPWESSSLLGDFYFLKE